VDYSSGGDGENGFETATPMSNLIRSLSSLMSGRTDALPGASTPEASAAAGTEPAAAPTAATLPMVAAYAVTPEEMAASSRLRRSRSVSLLRSRRCRRTRHARARRRHRGPA
jgi:hypothetical protein